MDSEDSDHSDSRDKSDKGFMETAFFEQRLRAERHKSNFEELKVQHTKLQEAYTELQLERDSLSTSYQQLTRQTEELVSQLQRERDDKIMECEQLRLKVLTPGKAKAMKSDIVQEVSSALKKDLSTLDGELEVMKEDYQSLQYSYQFLKSEYEAAKASYESSISEMKAKHQTELLHYSDEMKELKRRVVRDKPTEVMKTRDLQRSCSELQEKLAVLRKENDELQSVDAVRKSSSHQHQLGLKREMSELQAVVEALNIEKSSLESQLTSVREQLNLSHQQQHSLMEEVSQAQRQLARVKRKMEEQEHLHKKEQGQIRLKHQKELSDVRREKQDAQEDEEMARSECQSLHGIVKQLKSALADKEEQLSSARHSELDREWEKTMALDKRCAMLEEQLAEASRTIAAIRDEKTHQMRRMEDQCSELMEEKTQCEDQLRAMKEQLLLVTRQCNEHEKECIRLSGIEKRHKQLVQHNESLLGLEQQAHSNEDRLNTALREAQTQLLSMQQQLTQTQEAHSKELSNLRAEKEAERVEWNRKTEEVSSQLKGTSDQLQCAQKTHKKATRQHRKTVEQLQQLLEEAQTREKELIIEREAVRLKAEEETRALRKRLHNIHKQQHHFQLVLNSAPNSLDYLQQLTVAKTDFMKECR